MAHKFYKGLRVLKTKTAGDGRVKIKLVDPQGHTRWELLPYKEYRAGTTLVAVEKKF